MFIRPDARQLKSLARLAQSDEGKVLQELLATELQTLTSHLLDSSGETTCRLQGMAREVADLVALLRDAPELAQRSR